MKYFLTLLSILIFSINCIKEPPGTFALTNNLNPGILDYNGTPLSQKDRTHLAFSDDGAWFAYSFPDEQKYYGGFSGPFLMTQENGVWISPALSRLTLQNNSTGSKLNWDDLTLKKSGYSSHLEQEYSGKGLTIIQRLFFLSPHTAMINTQLLNKSEHSIEFSPSWSGNIFSDEIRIEKYQNCIKISSKKSPAIGFIRIDEECLSSLSVSERSYEIKQNKIIIEPGGSEYLNLTQTFIFPEYSISEEFSNIKTYSENPLKHLQKKIDEKKGVLDHLNSRLSGNRNSPEYKILIAKSVLTMQNNWRVPAGDLKHSGLFPSYHYKWFHGFWAWDSWKHAAALSLFNPELAKEQVRAMYNFQEENGMIADCVYRDTSIEEHNYRNTKPPLSAWAVWRIFGEDRDISFLEEMFPKIVKQHEWWYEERDHDRDRICEYGSTDGTLTAAKWESGMDNGVRFDKSRLLKNSDSAWSLDQESVDLNSYLYAEKVFLSKIAKELNKDPVSGDYEREAAELKKKIREQFYDNETGWFYDTSIDGKKFITVIGCEGWIPLWAEAATSRQADKIREKMIDPSHFNGRVPLQTLSADNPEFDPENGYWRGPVWLDQAYFGIMGLESYGFNKDADMITARLIHNAGGVSEKGKSLRENYDPVSGKGLNARNFSWTAAHFMLLLLDG